MDTYLEQIACLGRNSEDCFTIASLGRFLDTDGNFDLSVNYCFTLKRFVKSSTLVTQNSSLNLGLIVPTLNLIKFNTLIATIDLITANLSLYLVNYRLQLTRYPLYLALVKPLEFLLVERVVKNLEFLLVKEYEFLLDKQGLIFELTRYKCLH